VVADHDHAVAGEKLGALAIGREESTFLAFKSLWAMHSHALARDQFGQRFDLALDPVSAFGIDVDQAMAGMLAAEGIARRDQPTLRVLVENDKVLSRRDADDDLAKPAPLVVGAKKHG